MGLLDLYFQDESGFAPTLPLASTWARAGTRPLVPHEAPEGRRVNVSGALAPFGPRPRLVYDSRLGKLDGTAFVQFVWQDIAQLPAVLPDGYQRDRPCVVVVDNYSVHHGQAVREARSTLAAADVTFFYLPPYSPDLNAPIEALWRQVKYHELPQRSFTTAAALKAAVDDVLARRATALTLHPAPAPTTSFLKTA
jgi:hypothetical protein